MVESFELRVRRGKAERVNKNAYVTVNTGNSRRQSIVQAQVGKRKTFDEIRQTVESIQAHLADVQQDEESQLSNVDKKDAAYRNRHSSICFPGIELLASFRPQVLKEAQLRASQTKQQG